MAASRLEMGPTDALLVVDVQRDFCPGGALEVPEGDRVVESLNRWSQEAADAKALVVASRDWHPAGHVSFQQRGGPWPPHCVQGSEGAALHPNLDLPPDRILISKGHEPDRDAYSAFDGTGLASLLEERGVKRVFVGGLALDVCVRATALEALELGLETHVLVDGSRPIDPAEGRKALEELEARGAILHVEATDA